MTKPNPLAAIIMGSSSDWETMSRADEILDVLKVPHICQVISAHRTPDRMAKFALNAESCGIAVIIAGAGGAAHLPGMIAAHTHLPILGVPVRSRSLNGLDSLLSIVQMPRGIPVGSLAIGEAGAENAAILAASILALTRPALRSRLVAYRENQPKESLERDLPSRNFSRNL